MNYSFWEQQYWNKKFDFVIIGAGFTGLNVAINLKEQHAKARVLVIDKNVHFSLASTKNAGFACFASPSELISDLSTMGQEQAFWLLKKRFEGISIIEKNYENHCEYRKCNAFEWFVNKNLYDNSINQIEKLNFKLKEAIGLSNTYERHSEFQKNHSVIGAIKINGEGQINPVLLHEKLIANAVNLGVDILDNNLVKAANSNQIVTDNGLLINTSQVINCSNSFSKKLFSNIEIEPARAQVLITNEIENLPYNGNYHMDEGYYYFRNVGNRLLLGGARNEDFLGEKNYEFGINPKVNLKLKQVLEQLLPNENVKIESEWSGIMGFSNNKMPIKRYENSIYHLVGMSGMGVALAFSLSKDLVNEIN